MLLSGSHLYPVGMIRLPLFDEVCLLEVGNPLRTLFVDQTGNIWTSDSNTLYRVDPVSGNIEHILNHVYVHDVSQDHEGRVFISTLNGGLFVYSTDGKLLCQIDRKAGLVSDFVRTVCQIPSGDYWVGTDKGLQVVGADLTVKELYVADGEEGSLNNSSIYDILCDRCGMVWVATYFGGINVCFPDGPDYQVLKARPDEKGLSSNLVSCMTADKRGHLWIGSVDAGLTCYDPDSRHYTWFRHDSSRNSISGDNIKTLYYDEEEDILWIGTHLQGFCSLDLRTHRFRNFRVPGHLESPMADVVSTILSDGKSLILVTYRGVFRFWPSDQRFEKLLDLSYLRSAYLDSRHGLWMGSTSGQLFLYDLDSGSLQSFGRILHEQNNGKNSIIYGMTEDGDGNIWLASFGGGLRKYDVSEGRFETMNTMNSQIPSDNVLSVRHLGGNRLIATIHDGYFIYDIVKREFDVRVRNYGLPVNYVMENSIDCSSDGETVYIGTNDGLLSFSVNRLFYPYTGSPVVFSKLWVNGEEVHPGDDSGILQQSMMYTDEIVLNHEQNSFAVEFFQPDQHLGNGTSLMYCLDGDRRNWQSLLPGETTLHFYNQSPGNYRILVKDPELTDENLVTTSLSVRIRPPFYRTTLAYFLYAFTILLVLGIIIYISLQRFKIKERLRYEKKKMHYEKAQMLSKHQAKLQFFFAISHEFSTPLTIILGQLELLLMKYDFTPLVKDKLTSIYKNALQLHDLLFELLEFRKNEMGQMKPEVAEYDLCTIAEESFQLYKEYSVSRGVRFDLVMDPGPILVWCDRKQLYKVFNNLLSNAFKYTDEGGTVSLTVTRMETEICIEVTDNGCGMDADEVAHIFDEFYQGRQAAGKTGVGIGLHLVKSIINLHKGRIEVKSELNKGTSFFVYLKSGNGHFTLEELSRNPISDTAALSVKSGLRNPLPQLSTTAALDADDVAKSPENPELLRTLLIVEDNNALRDILVNVFSQYYHVLSAVDGRDGWNTLQQNDVDIVVTDILMPNMSGTELCEKIKDDFKTCHIPVVLLSVRAEVQNCIEGFNARADDYITKPFSVRLLLSRCANLLNNRSLLQKKFRQSPNAGVEVLTTNVLDQEFTEKLIRVIEENIDDSNLNIAFLQQEMYVSRTTLFQKLKAITGQTPMEFIMNIRLKKAAELLLTRPDLPIATVSDMTGFGSSKYFSRIFKETYHIRPMDYRNGKKPETEK